MPEVHRKDVTVTARDGYDLAATLFEPSSSDEGAFVLLGSAMGVPRRFYDRFATGLAARGLPALTVDYRGIGGSAPDGLRGFEASLRGWAEQDLAGALDWIERTRSPTGIRMLGHSVAGQLFGLIPGNDRVQRLAVVASVKGHWRLWPLRYRPHLLAIWYLISPTVTPLFGYFPSRLAGLGGEDLPRGVAEEWTRWGRSRDYHVDEKGETLHEGFRAYPGSVRAYSFTDDWYAPERPVAELVRLFEHARTEHLHLCPADRGMDAIGHFGFFRPACEPLWDEVADWLAAEEP